MFWGLIMEPQRRYTQKVKKAFHVSMAALDISTNSDEPAQVLCGYGDRIYLLCTLRKPDVLQCPLDLSFEVGSEISFATNGKSTVHLTGYLDVMSEYDLEENVEEEEEVEVPKSKKNKRIKKEVANGPPAKKKKLSVSMEEDDPEDDDDSDEDSSVDLKALLGNSLAEDDEDDESFNAEESEDGSEAEVLEEEEADDEAAAEEESDEADEDKDEDDEESSLSEQEENEIPKKEKKVQENGIPKKKKKEIETSKKPQGELKASKNKKNLKETPQEKKTPEKTSRKTLQGGVIIEDIKEGLHAPAKNGKLVTVYYEGRLKQGNKVFDATTKGNGFSFRLGAGEVIKGWDIGVVGMKVGGKRRITCPPAMAYGTKGSPPAIPGNSTLVFEVELRKVR